MARDVSVLFCGARMFLNWIADTPGVGEAVDNVNGVRTKVVEELATDVNRNYVFKDATSDFLDYPWALREANQTVFGQDFWPTVIAPQLPADLVVIAAAEWAYSSFPFSVNIIKGDEYGMCAIALTAQLLEEGANCVMHVPYGLPNALTDPARTAGGDGGSIATQSRVGDYLLGMSDVARLRRVIQGPDLRTIMTPVSSFYVLTGAAAPPAAADDQQRYPNNSGAALMGQSIGQSIINTPTYLLQPDQDGT